MRQIFSVFALFLLCGCLVLDAQPQRESSKACTNAAFNLQDYAPDVAIVIDRRFDVNFPLVTLRNAAEHIWSVFPEARLGLVEFSTFEWLAKPTMNDYYKVLSPLTDDADTLYNNAKNFTPITVAAERRSRGIHGAMLAMKEAVVNSTMGWRTELYTETKRQVVKFVVFATVGDLVHVKTISANEPYLGVVAPSNEEVGRLMRMNHIYMVSFHLMHSHWFNDIVKMNVDGADPYYTFTLQNHLLDVPDPLANVLCRLAPRPSKLEPGCRVSVTVEAPGVQNSTAQFSRSVIDQLDYNYYVAPRPFGGVTDGNFVGHYTNLNLAASGINGGSGGKGFYASADVGKVTTLTFNNVQSYFGYFGLTTPGSLITFKYNNKRIASIDGSGILEGMAKALPNVLAYEPSNSFPNHVGEYTGFKNFFFKGEMCYFNSVEIGHSSNSVDNHVADNLTVGVVTRESGSSIIPKLSFRPLKKKEFASCRVLVKVEEPGVKRTTAVVPHNATETFDKEPPQTFDSSTRSYVGKNGPISLLWSWLVTEASGDTGNHLMEKYTKVNVQNNVKFSYLGFYWRGVQPLSVVFFKGPGIDWMNRADFFTGAFANLKDARYTVNGKFEGYLNFYFVGNGCRLDEVIFERVAADNVVMGDFTDYGSGKAFPTPDQKVPIPDVQTWTSPDALVADAPPVQKPHPHRSINSHGDRD